MNVNPPDRNGGARTEVVFRALASLALAFLLWAWVTTQRDPPETRVFADLTLADPSLPEPLQISGELPTVSIEVLGPRSVMDRVSRAGLRPVLDVSQITEPGSYNAQIDVDVQPHKSAGFLTGIPAPVGAGLAFLPFYLWQATGEAFFHEPLLVGPWVALVALLMISNLATLSWASMRPRRTVRLWLILLVGLVFAALLMEPWWTLVAICLGYLATLPVGFARYARVKRQRGTALLPSVRN